MGLWSEGWIVEGVRLGDGSVDILPLSLPEQVLVVAGVADLDNRGVPEVLQQFKKKFAQIRDSVGI